MMKYSIAKPAVVIIAVVMMGLLCLPDTDEVYAAGSDAVIVSLGDSYSSGEGIPPFYGHDKGTGEKGRTSDPDWIAHRSTKSWPGQLKQPGQEKSVAELKLKDRQWFFVASSGAETKHIDKNLKPYKKDPRGYQDDKVIVRFDEADLAAKYPLRNVSKTVALSPQLNVFKYLDDKKMKTDYVTVTIGGNDLGFREIVETAVFGPTQLVRDGKNSKLESLLEEKWKLVEDGTIEDRLVKTYGRINQAADGKAKIIVVGYPRLFYSGGSGVLITEEEAEAINNKVEDFDVKIAEYVEKCEKDMDITYVTVIDKFGDRGAYAKNSLLNAIKLVPREGDISSIKPSAYSIHPNEKGAKLYAECVQEKIDGNKSTSTSVAKDVVGAWYWAGSGAAPPIKLNKNGTLEIEEVIGEWEERGSWSCTGTSVTIIRDGLEEKLKYNKEKDILFYEAGGEISCYKRYDQESNVQKQTYLDYFASINQTNKPYSEIDKKYGLKAIDEMTDSWMTFASVDDKFHFTFESTNTKMFDNGLGDSWEVPDDPNPSDRCERMSGSAKDMLGIKESVSEQEFQNKCKEQLMFPMGAGPGVDLMTSTYTGLVDICTLSDGNTYHILLKDVLYGDNIDPDTEVFIQYYPFVKNKDSLIMEGGY